MQSFKGEQEKQHTHTQTHTHTHTHRDTPTARACQGQQAASRVLADEGLRDWMGLRKIVIAGGRHRHQGCLVRLLGTSSEVTTCMLRPRSSSKFRRSLTARISDVRRGAAWVSQEAGPTRLHKTCCLESCPWCGPFAAKVALCHAKLTEVPAIRKILSLTLLRASQEPGGPAR